LGYYGVYTSANGSDVFYDYCGTVRGVQQQPNMLIAAAAAG
jgi:hypothetical protein